MGTPKMKVIAAALLISTVDGQTVNASSTFYKEEGCKTENPEAAKATATKMNSDETQKNFEQYGIGISRKADGATAKFTYKVLDCEKALKIINSGRKEANKPEAKDCSCSTLLDDNKGEPCHESD